MLPILVNWVGTSFCATTTNGKANNRLEHKLNILFMPIDLLLIMNSRVCPATIMPKNIGMLFAGYQTLPLFLGERTKDIDLLEIVVTYIQPAGFIDRDTGKQGVIPGAGFQF